MNDKLLQIFKQKPYLAWDIKDPSVLSEKTMVEHILAYGNWEDFKETLNILGMNKTADLFNETIQGPRNNYRIETVEFFKQFFKEHAQGNIK